MVGITGKIIAVGKKGRVQVELMNSGQIVDLSSNERFFIGDPVLVSSEGGKISGFTRAAKKSFYRSSEHERLGPYWKM